MTEIAVVSLLIDLFLKKIGLRVVNVLLQFCALQVTLLLLHDAGKFFCNERKWSCDLASAYTEISVTNTSRDWLKTQRALYIAVMSRERYDNQINSLLKLTTKTQQNSALLSYPMGNPPVTGGFSLHVITSHHHAARCVLEPCWE